MSRLLITILFSILSFNIYAYDRVVLLAPASADIFIKLGLSEKVVGVTRSIKELPDAKRVGSHIRPNIEILRSLRPDLVVISSNRFFTEEMGRILKCDVYKYNPITLEGILEHISVLGKKFSKVNIAKSLKTSLRSEISGLLYETSSPTVFYEVTQMPFIAAGAKNIIKDIVERAGGRFVITEERKVFKLGIEKVLIAKPEFYIYQVGPMNKNPVPPNDRNEYKRLRSRFIKVDEKKFSRANTQSFKNVKELNKLFATH